jgi:type II secretory pathway predicted ATPase ExeA
VDEEPPGSPADDPTFLAGLNNLDRGLSPDDDPLVRIARQRPNREFRRRGADRRVAGRTTPDTVVGFVADPAFLGRLGAATPADVTPRRRPLLDLFPAYIGVEPPPGPLLGTAVPPPLPPQVRLPVAVEKEPPADARLPDTFYGLNENAFSLSSDPKFFYPSQSHDRVLNRMLEAIHRRKGVVVLTGEPGLGKTMVCRTAARELDRHTVTSLVLDPSLSIEELLKSVLVNFGVVSRDDLAHAPDVTRELLTATLFSFLESLVPLHAHAVIVIDDAHDTPAGVLAEIPEVLAALDRSGRVQIALVGAPALKSALKRRELAPLVDLVDVRLELAPLGDDEVAPYVRHRLRIAGSSARVDVSDAAFARIYALSRGIPRVVNQLCDRALAHGARGSASVIDATLVGRAADDLDLASPGGEPRTLMRNVVTAMALIALMLVGAAAATWVFRDAASRAFLEWQNVPPRPPGDR